MFLEPDTNSVNGATTVKVSRMSADFTTPLRLEYDPTNPLADDRGFVAMPNVDTTLESADLREAARSYEANLSAIDSTKTMMTRTLDVLR